MSRHFFLFVGSFDRAKLFRIKLVFVGVTLQKAKKKVWDFKERAYPIWQNQNLSQLSAVHYGVVVIVVVCAFIHFQGFIYNLDSGTSEAACCATFAETISPQNFGLTLAPSSVGVGVI